MELLNVILKIKSASSIQKILILNDLNLSINDVIEIGKYVQELYVSYYNNFMLRNLLVKVRHIKNIKVIEPRLLPNINYDLICSPILSNDVLLILSKIKYIRYFYCINEDELKNEIPGFKKDLNIKNLYVKDSLVVEINNNVEFKNEQLSNNVILLRKNEEININQNIIQIKNVVSSLTKFSYFKDISNINNGELNICCYLELKKDYEIFLDTVEFFNKNYPYIKYFIFLSGPSIQKYFNEERMKKLNYVLIKSNDKSENFKNSCLYIFNILANGIYKLYMHKLDFNKEIIDLL